MNGANVKQLHESLGPTGFYHKITECLREGALKHEQIDLQEMAIGMLGERAYMKLGERYSQRRGDASAIELCQHGDSRTGAQYAKLEESAGWFSDPATVLREAGEAVDVAGFSAITGQIAYNAIGKGWNNAEMIGDRIFKNFPTEFSGQKIPWLSNIFGSQPGDGDIHPGMDYPETTFGPRYVTSPPVLKKGGILSVSLEFMLFDRTGQAGSMGLEKLGQAIRYQKEYMQLRTLMAYNPVGPLTANSGSTVNNRNFGYNLNGSYLGQYNTSGSNFINAQGSTPLVDYTSLANALQLRSQILDPDTGRPMLLSQPKTLFVMPGAVWAAKRILNATETRTTYPGYGASTPAAPGNVQLIAGNPIEWNLQILTSPIAQQIAAQAALSPAGVAGTGSANTVNAESQYSAWWMLGDFPEALWYAEIFPFRSEQAIAGNIREFQSDIKLRFKVSEMGVPFWYDPRQILFFYNS